jgi:sialate O-acetylesterase
MISREAFSVTALLIIYSCLLLLLLYVAEVKSKTVLCVGDSLTWGTGTSNRDIKSYPALLPDLLNQYIEKNTPTKQTANINVVNLGVKGATAIKVSLLSYASTSEYASLATFKDVSVVVLLLGANDALYHNKFNEDTFTRDYLELIDYLHILDGHPVIFICIPTVLLPRYSSTKVNSTVTNWIYPHLFPKLAERSKHAKLINLYTAVGGNISTDIWQCCTPGTINNYNNDGLHLNDRGYSVIADKIASEIWKFVL